MKHFSDDSCNKLPEYDRPTIYNERDWDSMKDYEMNIGGPHYEQDPDDWYEETIKHFQD